VSFAARELLPALREEYGKVDDVAVRPRQTEFPRS
jgi:hypothetical protein